jgi:type VI secretion system secreted protein Hcp
MAVNTFLSFFDKAAGESIQKGKNDWVEVQRWDWDVDAETSWTKGGGASVGKPNPGSMNFEHFFDTSSTVILGYICTGKSFPKVELQITKSTGGKADTFFTMTLENVFITKVSHRGDEEGNIVQRVEMVFKTIKIEYRSHQKTTGQLGAAKIYSWDIPAGTASPSA